MNCVSRVKYTDTKPHKAPKTKKYGKSDARKGSVRLKEKRTSEPKVSIETNEPITEAMSSGIKAAMVTSVRITSILKITPATGELKIPDIAAAAPQPIMSVRCL